MEERPYKIVLAGRHRVGKTSIFRSLQKEGDVFSKGMQTVETGTGLSGRKDREKWMVHMYTHGREVTVILWDTGGMERYGMHNLTRSYFAKSKGVILVYDTGNLESLNDLAHWIATARDYTNDSVIFSLWGNDCGEGKDPVDDEAVRNFAEKSGISLALSFNVCVSTGDNLTDSFKKTVDAVHLMNTNQRLAEDVYPILTRTVTMDEKAPNAWGKCFQCY